MEIQNKEQLISDTVTRVLNNAPISEILRVYSLALQSEVLQLSDEELLEALVKAGYTDLIKEHFPEEYFPEEYGHVVDGFPKDSPEDDYWEEGHLMGGSASISG